MIALVEQGYRRKRRYCASVLLAGLIAFWAGADPAKAADVFSVVLDQAKVFKIPERTTTVVVGNPLIADISVQSGGIIVVTGKGYGITNLIAMDTRGDVVLEQTIEVRGPTDQIVVVYRGVERESYSCMPKCERRIMLGDSAVFFESVITQSDSRSSKAQSAGQSGGSR